jgi:hypothetical protein
MTFILSLAALATSAQTNPAYSIFTGDGKDSDYGKMLRVLYDADIIFIFFIVFIIHATFAITCHTLHLLPLVPFIVTHFYCFFHFSMLFYFYI